MGTIDWSEIFPDDDYALTLRLQRSTPGEFFAAQDGSGKVLAERRRWLTDAASWHVAATDGVEPLWEEALRIFEGISGSGRPLEAATAIEKLTWLGTRLEPDFALLRRREGRWWLVGGCVCFPSSWSLSEKIGRELPIVHGVVPGLNEALGTSMERLFDRMAPGLAWLRANWGLSRSAELNQDPWRKLPRLDPSVQSKNIFVRLERQALVRLPVSDGLLFGIRVDSVPLSELAGDSLIRPRLRRAIATMPEPMARYKGIAGIRAALLDYLQS